MQPQSCTNNHQMLALNYSCSSVSFNIHANTSLVQWYMVMLEFTTHHEPLCTPCTQRGIAEHPIDKRTMATATCTATFPRPGQGYQRNNNTDQRNCTQHKRRQDSADKIYTAHLVVAPCWFFSFGSYATKLRCCRWYNTLQLPNPNIRYQPSNSLQLPLCTSTLLYSIRMHLHW